MLLSYGLAAGHSISFVIATLVLAVIFGLDGPWPFSAVLVAAFLIYLLH
jgi:hypothetical protein